MKTILVPTDFSKQADNALNVAVSISLITGAEIKLLHVVEGIYEDPYSTTGTVSQEDSMDKVYVMRMIDRAGKLLSEKISKYPSVKIHPLVKVGGVYHHISQSIADMNVDLIVMGTKGVHGLKEIITGSNTDKVVRLAKCPVLSVRDEKKAFTIDNMLLATDFRDDNPEFFKRLTDLQKVLGFRLHIVYVNTPVYFRSDDEIYAYYEAFIQANSISNCDFKVINEFSEEEGIRSYANKLNADVITIATHQRKGIPAALLGSLSKDLVNYSHRPVLTFAVQ